MGSEHEFFAEAPLAWVACEICFPVVPGLTDEDSFRSLAEAFSHSFPIPRDGVQPPDGELDALAPERHLRFLNKSHTMSMSLTRCSLTAETTDYKQWGHFKSDVLNAAEAVSSLARIVGIERIGLRYINEIRVPASIGNALGWKGWINEEVLGHLQQVPEYSPESFGTALCCKKDGYSLNVWYAALTGQGVVLDEPLKRRRSVAHGPFFVIDTDSFLEVLPGERSLDFHAEALVPVLEKLHDPVESVFQNAITEKLRDLFREGA